MAIKTYKVGGWVRDQILGVKSNDLDYSVEAESFDEMKAFVATQGQIFLESPEYLTIRAKDSNGEVVDFVLCRKDGNYTDGRRPDEVIAGDIFDDLSRRDFTMNAIALDEDGNYLDPYDGRGDIKNKIIKCVGKTEDRFAEDALRILRAFRFAITKDFFFHKDIIEALGDPEMITRLSTISQERIQGELQKCFEFDTLKTIDMLSDYRLLRDWIFTNTTLWLNVTAKQK